MASEIEKFAVEGNLLDRLSELERKVSELQRTPIKAAQVSEISQDMGIFVGDHICPSGEVTDPTDPAFSGSFMTSSGVTFGSDTYHVGGVSEGAIQWGADSTNGKFVAANGNLTIDNEGMVLTGNSNDITWKSAGSSADEDLYQIHMGPRGSGLEIVFHRNDAPTETITNGDFATGDFTGWTQAEADPADPPTKWSVVDMGGGTYRAEYTGASGSSETLKSSNATFARNEVFRFTGRAKDCEISVDYTYSGGGKYTVNKYFGLDSEYFEIWGQPTFDTNCWIVVRNTSDDAWFTDFSLSKFRGVKFEIQSNMASSGTQGNVTINDLKYAVFRNSSGNRVYIGVDDLDTTSSFPPLTMLSQTAHHVLLPIHPNGIFFNAGTAAPEYSTIYNDDATLIYGKDDGNLYIQPVGTTDADAVITDAMIGGYTDPLTLSERATDPSTPAAGYREVFAGANGLFDLNSGGTLSRLAAVDCRLPVPPAPVGGTPTTGGSQTVGTKSYKQTYYDLYGETAPSAKSNVVTVANSTNDRVPVTLSLGPAGTVGRKLYRTVAGDTGAWKLVATIADNTTTSYNDDLADASLGADAPAANTTRDAITRFFGQIGTTQYTEGVTQDNTTGSAYTRAATKLQTKIPLWVTHIILQVKNAGAIDVKLHSSDVITEGFAQTLWSGSVDANSTNTIRLSSPLLLMPQVTYWLGFTQSSSTVWRYNSSPYNGTYYSLLTSFFGTTSSATLLPIQLVYHPVTWGL